VLRKINQNLSSADLLFRLGSSSLATVSSATHKAETVLLDGQEYAWQRCRSWRCGDILLAGTRVYESAPQTWLALLDADPLSAFEHVRTMFRRFGVAAGPQGGFLTDSFDQVWRTRPSRPAVLR